MTKRLKTVMAAVVLMCAVGAWAQTGSAKRPVKKVGSKAPVESTTDQLLRELKEQMQNQQAQIDALKQQLAARDANLNSAARDAQAANAAAAAAASQAQSMSSSVQANAEAVTTLNSTVSDLKSTTSGMAQTISDTKKDLTDKMESPTTIRYKGLTITPVAFMAFEGAWRQHSVNSDINTPFNSIPLPSANQGHVSELNFSARQSRLGGLFEGNAGPYRLSGYFETDFLGTGTSSNNNQSNSYVMRQRQIWGKIETQGGLAVTGGQMWSLVTENGQGANNRTEKLPNTIDPQYMVGFSWTRQPGIRVQQRFGDYTKGALTLALSIEQAQITNFTAAGQIPSNYFFAGFGQNGGLYNAAASSVAVTGTTTCTTPSGTATCVTAVTPGDITTYANNVAPDLVVKGAYDYPKVHIEVGGLARFLRDYYFPILTVGGTATATTYTYAPNYVSHTAAAGGGFGSVRVSPSKYADIAVQMMAGQGVGRYGSSQLADATLRPDGTLEPIRNYHGMFSLETHPTKNLDVFAYYGAEYAQRTVYTNAAGGLIGYGPRNLSNAGCYNSPVNPNNIPANAAGSIAAQACASPTRYIQEPMIGFIYRVVNSPRFGRLQYWATYSYFQRNLWSGVGSATAPSGPRATEPMVDISMRYYIP